MTLPGWVGVREPRGRLGGRYAKNVTICPTQACTTPGTQSCAACPLPGVRAYELHDARELSTFVSQMHPFSRAYIYGFSLPYGFTREISLTDTVSHAHIETSSVTLTDSTHTFCGTARDFSKRSTRCRRSLSGSSRRGSRRRRRRRPTGSSSQRRAPTEATWEEEMAAAARAAA